MLEHEVALRVAFLKIDRCPHGTVCVNVRSKAMSVFSSVLSRASSKVCYYFLRGGGGGGGLSKVKCVYFGLFAGSLLPNVFKSHAWGILHTLLEMFSYRLHHIQPHYRVTLLSHLHSLAAVPHTNQNQLHLW